MKTRFGKTARLPCEIDACKKSCEVFLYTFESRRLVKKHHLCKAHAKRELTGKFPDHYPERIKAPVEVDLDFLFCALGVPSFLVGFLSVDDACRFNLRISRRQAAAIRGFAEEKDPKSELGEAVDSTSKARRGASESIEIDCDETGYTARLRLSRCIRSIELLAAADAVLMALSAKLPIYVTPTAINAFRLH